MAGNVLTLTLESSMDRQSVDAVLDTIRRIAGVRSAGLIAPNAKGASARAVAYAELDGEADAFRTAQKVGAVPGVVRCSVPPERYLL
jgi:hypothetical protein